MSKKVKLDAWQKFQNSLLTQYNIEQLAELKRSNWSGLLLGIDKLYATMYHEWDALQKDVNDIAGAVRTLEWTVTPNVKDGEEPSELAQQVADVVNEALWKRAKVPLGGFSHSFLQLVESMVHAIFRGYNVHQIEWVNDGQIVYPGRYVQLYPQFLMWETQCGKPDRLLLVPDGQSGQGVPFAEDMFIVALNNNGPDHPVYNATFYSLVNWFLAYKFGLGWFMQFAQKYGMPKQVFRYGSEREKEQLINEMEDDRVLNSIFLKGDRQYEIINPVQGGASLPQAVLVQKAEEACHKAILGQTLTSDTSSHGGSLAQAKVHAGVRSELVLQKAEFVCEILNQQLIPAIVRLNFGRSEGMPLPELRCKLPQEQHTADVLNYWKTVKEMGVPFKKSEFHDSTGISMPGEGDDVYGGEQQGAIPGMDGVIAPQDGNDDDPEPPGGGGGGGSDAVEAAKSEKIDAAQEWLAPLKERLKAARARGASLADIAKEAKEWRLNTVALAQSMAENVKRGLLGEASSEEVKAENPYGCNQYEHAPDCENTGKANGVKKKLGEVKQALEKLGQGNESLRKGLELTAKLLDGYMRDFAQASSEAERTAILAEAQDMVDYAQDLLGDVEKLGNEEQEPKAKRYFPEAKDIAEATRNTQALAEGAAVNWGEGFPVHIVNQYNEAMGEMMEKYPLRAKFVRLGAYVDNKGSTLAHCRAGAMGGEDVLLLELNKNHDINGIHALPEGRLFSEEEQARIGYTRHNVGATEDGMTVRAVTIHEYGHGIKAWCNLRSMHSDMFDIDEVREARSALDEWSQAVKSARASGFKVSQYGDSDDEEFFAECFAARELGEKLPEGVERAMNKLVVLALKK